MEVVGQAARADDQHTSFCQRRQYASQVPGTFPCKTFRQRNLDDRHLCLGQQVHKRHPRAVVQSSLGISLRFPTGIAQKTDHSLGQLGIAGRWIVNVAQSRVESAKVMNGLRAVACSDPNGVGHPVR